MEKYKVFHRTWYDKKGNPEAGRKFFICWAYSYSSAQDICRVWNENHEPGYRSDKAEFERC